jgi:ABC-type nitrate/sulfonate/bicarbonate transport system substrate-binding protein
MQIGLKTTARAAALSLSLITVASVAGGAVTAGEPADRPSPESAESLGEIVVLLPIDSPNVYGFKLAEALGYFEQEGVDVTLEYVDGSGQAMQQLLAENGDVAVVGTGTVLDALEEGEDHVRVIGNVNYGSVFFLSVPEGSDIDSADDLAGTTVGISELSGGEVPVVEGIIRSAGLVPGEDVQLLPIGTGTALAVRAIEEGQVDAYGGSVNDLIAVEVQGVPLRRILPEVLTTLPGLPVVTTQPVLDEKSEAVIAFMRAMTMGQEFGLANPDAALAILMEQNPEQFTDETGGLIFEAILPLWTPPEGELFGSQTIEQWEAFSEFVQAELPEGADLDTVIVEEIAVEANEFDHEAVQEEAENYPDG